VAERRAVSLLDCAIAASLAVVPVLLGVVALVAFVRPDDPDSFWRQGHSDRYVSVSTSPRCRRSSARSCAAPCRSRAS